MALDFAMQSIACQHESPRNARRTPETRCNSQDLPDLKNARRFREEGGSGFLDDRKSAHPRARTAVTELRREQGKILKELRNLLSATMACAEGNLESRCDLSSRPPRCCVPSR